MNSFIAVKLKYVYLGGAVPTTFLIGVGNVVNSIFLSNRFKDLMYYSSWSAVKGITYGMIWPVFWPYALYKTIIYEPDYEIRCGVWINQNGMDQHFIPGGNKTFKKLKI